MWKNPLITWNCNLNLEYKVWKKLNLLLEFTYFYHSQYGRPHPSPNVFLCTVFQSLWLVNEALPDVPGITNKILRYKFKFILTKKIPDFSYQYGHDGTFCVDFVDFHQWYSGFSSFWQFDKSRYSSHFVMGLTFVITKNIIMCNWHLQSNSKIINCCNFLQKSFPRKFNLHTSFVKKCKKVDFHTFCFQNSRCFRISKFFALFSKFGPFFKHTNTIHLVGPMCFWKVTWKVWDLGHAILKVVFCLRWITSIHEKWRFCLLSSRIFVIFFLFLFCPNNYYEN